MNRRQWLTRSAVAAPFAVPLFLNRNLGERASAAPGTEKLTPLKITDVKTFLMAPAGMCEQLKSWWSVCT